MVLNSLRSRERHEWMGMYVCPFPYVFLQKMSVKREAVKKRESRDDREKEELQYTIILFYFFAVCIVIRGCTKTSS